MQVIDTKSIPSTYSSRNLILDTIHKYSLQPLDLVVLLHDHAAMFSRDAAD